MLSAKLVDCEWREKVSAFSLFFVLCQKLSLWDWLLAAWIYEEVFDDNSNDRSCDDTRDYDSSYDEEDY
jgi:hypothetical protein